MSFCLVAVYAAADPIVITDVFGLQAMSSDPTADYVLGNDIDASDTVNWNDGAGFIPVGDVSGYFSGTFDGAGFTISNLHIAPVSGNAGLFNRLRTFDGEVATRYVGNVVLENAFVSGVNGSGALAAYAWDYEIFDVSVSGSITGYTAGGIAVRIERGSTISRCDAAVTVNGQYRAGGIVAENFGSAISESFSTGSVSSSNSSSTSGGICAVSQDGFCLNSYSHASVSAGRVAGGLIGNYSVARWPEFHTLNCYSTGEVSVGAGGYSGGLIGSGQPVLTGASFWDTETSGQPTSAGGTGLTTALMQTKATFEDAGWDFDNEWTLVGKKYPTSDQVLDASCIINLEDLQAMVTDSNQVYVVTRYINAADSYRWNGGLGFEPIGNASTPFAGRLYGVGNPIDNLYINRPGLDGCGLFGEIAPTASIFDLTLRGARIVGRDAVGVVAGRTAGSTLSDVQLIGCRVAGANTVGGVTGAAEQGASFSEIDVRAGVKASGTGAGGVAGSTLDSTMEYIRADATVLGAAEVGGISGRLEQSSLTESHSYGEIEAGSNGGGIVGLAVAASIDNSFTGAAVSGGDALGGAIGAIQDGAYDALFAYGVVEGLSNTGGLVGTAGAGTVSRSFWDSETSGQASSAGGVEKTSAELYAMSTFDGETWDMASVWDISDGIYYPFLRWYPYRFVRTVDDLQAITTDGASNWVLLNDIDASGTADWNSGKGFIPISAPTFFIGSLDGRGHLVKNLYMNSPNNYAAALIEIINYGGIIENLRMKNLSVTDAFGYDVAGLGAYVSGANFLNVSVDGDITGSSGAGGLVFEADSTFFQGISFRGSISGGDEVGGIVGTAYYGAVRESYTSARITGNTIVGGIAGYTQYASVIESASLGDTQAHHHVGGLAGGQSGERILDSHVLGSVDAEGHVSGAIVALLNGWLQNAYQWIQMGNYVLPIGEPPFLGLVESTYIEEDCCYDPEYSIGETPLSPAEMRQSASYVNWDFESVWDIQEDVTFPYLRKLQANDDWMESVVDARNNFTDRDVNGDGQLSYGEGRLSYGTMVLSGSGDSLFTMEELLNLSVGEPGVESDIYVDFEYSEEEFGTPEQPFNTVLEGAAYVNGDGTGTVRFAAGSTPETIAISKPMRLLAEDGPVVVGQSAP